MNLFRYKPMFTIRKIIFKAGTLPKAMTTAVIVASILICGCSYLSEGRQVKSISREANDLFNQGNFEASLSKYKQIYENHPAAADRVLFEMGIIYAHPKNQKKDYQKSLECFREIIAAYPDSDYRRDSQMMTFQIQNVINKDRIIAVQQTQIETTWQRVRSGENDKKVLQNQVDMLRDQVEMREEQIETREKQIETLQRTIFLLKTEAADKVLIEKKERRLTLLSKGQVIKTYKIALGGDPVGPKERQGDNKTPEGIYIIDSRNGNSAYHLSLHISYPNERDKMRAKALNVDPGGDIMIHGIKNGLAWVGDMHAGIDWTQGCIAVTDEEMEEIYKLVPNGTIVEIRP